MPKRFTNAQVTQLITILERNKDVYLVFVGTILQKKIYVWDVQKQFINGLEEIFAPFVASLR